jgi:hypothetical protein
MAVTKDYSAEFLSSQEIPQFAASDTTEANDVISLANGGWAVSAQDNEGFLNLTFYDQNGNVIGQNLTDTNMADGVLAQLSGGDIIVVGDSGNSLSFQRFDLTGALVTSYTGLTTTANETHASVNALSTGGFVSTGQYEVTSGNSNIEVHIRDSDGVVVTDFEIANTTADDTNACVVGLNGGGFAVMFERDGNPYYAVYNNDGSVRVAVAQVSAFGASGEIQGTATADGGASFVYASGGFETIFGIDSDGNLTAFRGLGSGASDVDVTQLSNGLLVSSFSFGGVDVRGAIYDLPNDTVYGDNSTSPPHIVLDEGTDTTDDTAIAAIGMGRFVTTWDDATTGHSVQAIYQLVTTWTGDGDANTMTGDETVDVMNGNDGEDVLNGGANNDVLNGGDADDQIAVGTGSDTVDAGAGVDQIFMEGNLDATDRIDGGADSATLYLTGDYSAGVTLVADTIKNIGGIVLTSGNSYSLTFNDGNIGVGERLSIAGNSLDTGQNITINDAAETDGAITIYAGAGTNILTGGTGFDEFFLQGFFGSDDRINGGAGTDKVFLDDGYASLTINGTMMRNVELLYLDDSGSYSLTLTDNVIASGKSLTIFADQLSGSNALTLNAVVESNGVLHIEGGGGGDIVTLNKAFKAGSHFDGGAGSDRLNLDGDFSDGLNVTAGMLANVENIGLADGHSYKLIFKDGVVASGKSLMLDGSGLSAANILTFNGSAELDGKFTATGGDGDDSITGGHKADVLEGGGGNDTLNFTAGGIDQMLGDAGKDTFVAGAELTKSDRVDGGADSDTLRLNGDYSSGVTFGATTVVGVEKFVMAAGHDYKLVLADATVGAGATLTVDATALATANRLILNGSHETNGHLTLKGGAGNDVLTGGTQSDVMNGSGGDDKIDTSKGGADIVNGGAGDDTISTGTALGSDKIDGGSGFDEVVTTSASIPFGPNTMINVEKLTLAADTSYSINFDDTMIAKGKTLIVDASALGASHSFSMFFAGNESDGHYDVRGGKGNDQIEGGKLGDILKGGLGADAFYSSTGHDVFVYTGVAQSTGSAHDTMSEIDFKQDKIQLDVTVTGIDTKVTGAISLAAFDHDLAAAVGKHQLAAHHAVVLSPTGGEVGGLLLVVDANGKAGYQAGQDYVFAIGSDTHLDIHDFIRAS